MDKGAWWTTAYEMAESQTRLNDKAQHTHMCVCVCVHIYTHIYILTTNNQKLKFKKQ